MLIYYLGDILQILLKANFGQNGCYGTTLSFFTLVLLRRSNI